MKHRASQSVPEFDPKVVAHRVSAEVDLAIDKSMALVFWDAQPVAFVSCWATLFVCLDILFGGVKDSQEFHTFSLAWLPLTHGDAVVSLCFCPALWEACCENEDSMRQYFVIAGLCDPEDYEWERID